MPSVGTPAFHDCEGCEILIDINPPGSTCDDYAVIKLKNKHGDAMMFFDSIQSIRDFQFRLGVMLEKFMEKTA
jgi:hypothetical protein